MTKHNSGTNKPNHDPTNGELFDGVMTQDEVNDLLRLHSYEHVTRGTYRNESSYLYIKGCFRLDNKQDVSLALDVVRQMTVRGVVHPDTKWGAFKWNDGDGYQIFPVSPAIEAWSLERIGTEDESRFGDRSQADTAHVIEWAKRLDPDYDPASELDGGSLVGILNFTEASHPDNWGWDPETNINYPVDVEVIDLARNIDTVRKLYDELQ